MAASRSQSTRAGAAGKKLYSILLVNVILLSFLYSVVEGNACGGCYNGGQMLLPNNIFGVCRCKCTDGFKGPKCQFMSKRFYLNKRVGEGAENQLEENPVWGLLRSRMEELMSKNRFPEYPENE